MQNENLKQQIYFIIYGDFNETDFYQFQRPNTEILFWEFITAENDPAAVEQMKWPIKNSSFVDMLNEQNAVLVQQSLKAKHAISISAELINPENPLDNYLNILMLLNIIAFANGCIAIVDVRTATIYPSETWLKQIHVKLMEGIFNIHEHIMQSAILQENQYFWLHTKGMIKFGKPELSIHNISQEELNQFNELLNYIAQDIVLSNLLPKDQHPVMINNTPTNLIAYYGGDYEDDAFWHNIHIELIPKAD